MIIYDISSSDNAIKTILQLSGVNTKLIQKFISNSISSDGCFKNGAKLTAKNFINEFGLSEDTINLDDIRVCGIHYTSNDDENCKILNYGLRNLQFSLSADTPLKRFLSSHNIYFDIKKGRMSAGGKNFDINYTGGSFKLSNPISSIARKVYYDYALTCFLFIENIENYLGKVHIRPEILYDIDRLDSKYKLSQKWAKQCTAYEVKFASPISLFQPYSFTDDDERSLYEALLDKALLVAGDMSCDEVFAYMKPESVISKEQVISIQKII